MFPNDTEPAGTDSAVAKKMDGLPGDVFPARTTVPLKGLEFIYSSDLRAEPNNGRASLPLIWSSIMMAPFLPIYEEQGWRNVNQEMWGCFTRRRHKVHLSGKRLNRPSRTECILAEVFCFFFNSEE